MTSEKPLRKPLRLEIIKRSGEIERVSRSGRSFASPLFVMVCLPVENGPPRLAIKVSRKVGGAVVRNRIRRRVKSILRELFARLTRPVDCVVIGRQQAPGATFDQMKQELAGLLGRHGCLGGRRKPGSRDGFPDDAKSGGPVRGEERTNAGEPAGAGRGD